jgi:hypothetical protein
VSSNSDDEAASPPKEEPMQPDHDSLVAAVAATSDAELASWVADPSSYILRPAPEIVLSHHHAYRVVVLDASIPLSFLVVSNAQDGLVVTTSNPKGLHAVLSAEGYGDSSAGLAYALVREESREQTLLTGPAPQVRHVGAQWQIDLLVKDAARGEELWELRLSDEESTITRTPQKSR